MAELSLRELFLACSFSHGGKGENVFPRCVGHHQRGSLPSHLIQSTKSRAAWMGVASIWENNSQGLERYRSGMNATNYITDSIVKACPRVVGCLPCRSPQQPSCSKLFTYALPHSWLAPRVCLAVTRASFGRQVANTHSEQAWVWGPKGNF